MYTNYFIHSMHALHCNQCMNVTKALEEFYNAVASDSSVVAVVGCGCSSATEEVAKISHLWNVPVVSQSGGQSFLTLSMDFQISYASTSVVLSDRSVYHSFFRTVPSDELLVSAVAAILDSYEWRQLSVFTEEQPQFLQVWVIYVYLIHY